MISLGIVNYLVEEVVENPTSIFLQFFFFFSLTDLSWLISVCFIVYLSHMANVGCLFKSFGTIKENG